MIISRIDLKDTYDSKYFEALLKPLRLCSIPGRIMDPVIGLYFETGLQAVGMVCMDAYLLIKPTEKSMRKLENCDMILETGLGWLAKRCVPRYSVNAECYLYFK